MLTGGLGGRAVTRWPDTMMAQSSATTRACQNVYRCLQAVARLTVEADRRDGRRRQDFNILQQPPPRRGARRPNSARAKRSTASEGAGEAKIAKQVGFPWLSLALSWLLARCRVGFSWLFRPRHLGFSWLSLASGTAAGSGAALARPQPQAEIPRAHGLRDRPRRRAPRAKPQLDRRCQTAAGEREVARPSACPACSGPLPVA